MNCTDTAKRIVDRLGLTGHHWAFAAVEAELLAIKPLTGVSKDIVVSVLTNVLRTRDDKHRENLIRELLNALQAATTLVSRE